MYHPHVVSFAGCRRAFRGGRDSVASATPTVVPGRGGTQPVPNRRIHALAPWVDLPPLSRWLTPQLSRRGRLLRRLPLKAVKVGPGRLQRVVRQGGPYDRRPPNSSA